MPATAHAGNLCGTEDYVVESADGAVGRVEEVWLGDTAEPRALVVRMKDGRHALLLDEDVLTVDREHRWVVVGSEPALLELDAPRLASSDGRLVASWSTTGAVVHPEPRSRPSGLLQAARAPRAERPLWQQIVMLYAAVGLVVALVIALVFASAWVVSGAPY
jgi:hypothetical protein